MAEGVKRRIQLAERDEGIRAFFIRECTQFVNRAFGISHQGFSNLDRGVGERESLERLAITRVGRGTHQPPSNTGSQELAAAGQIRKCDPCRMLDEIIQQFICFIVFSG